MEQPNLNPEEPKQPRPTESEVQAGEQEKITCPHCGALIDPEESPCPVCRQSTAIH